MEVISELKDALEEAREERVVAVKAFQDGKGSEREAVSAALGELVLQTFDSSLTNAQKETIDGQRDFLRSLLKTL